MIFWFTFKQNKDHSKQAWCLLKSPNNLSNWHWIFFWGGQALEGSSDTIVPEESPSIQDTVPTSKPSSGPQDITCSEPNYFYLTQSDLSSKLQLRLQDLTSSTLGYNLNHGLLGSEKLPQSKMGLFKLSLWGLLPFLSTVTPGSFGS